MPLQPTLDGYHNASGYMYEGAVLLGPTTVPRTPQRQPSAVDTSPEPAGAHPIVLRAHFHADITAKLVSWGNPEGQVTKSEIELACSMIHHTYMAYFFDIRERTNLSCTDNTADLWCQRKGLATSTSPPTHILCLQSIHQRFHCYVICHNFVRGIDNGISDRPFLL